MVTFTEINEQLFVLGIDYYSVTKLWYTVPVEFTNREEAERIKKAIEECERLEANYERKQRYHRVVSFEGCEYLAGTKENEDPCSLVQERLQTEAVLKAINQISETQRRRWVLYQLGFTFEEIAQREGVSIASAYEAVKSASKKMEAPLKYWR